MLKDGNVGDNVDRYCQWLKHSGKRLFRLVNRRFPEICLNMLHVWFNLTDMFAAKDSNKGANMPYFDHLMRISTSPQGFLVVVISFKKIQATLHPSNILNCNEPALPGASSFSMQLRFFQGHLDS